MVGPKRNAAWTAVVEVWKGDFVLSPNLMANDDLVDVVEFVPILILLLCVAEQGLEFRTAWNGHV